MQSAEQAALQTLVARSISVIVSDPWDFATSVGFASFSAHVIAAARTVLASPTVFTEREQLLLEVARPFAFGGLRCAYFIAGPRHAGVSFLQWPEVGAISVGLERASSDRATSSEWYHQHRWSKEQTVYATATLTLLPSQTGA